MGRPYRRRDHDLGHRRDHGLGEEDIRIAKVGDTIPLGGYEIVFEDVRQYQGPNYVATRACSAPIRTA
jgi:cytochrome c biogenesis factor